jgi:ornithine lipid ester-linked acyl 2-hydroxylase
MLDRIPGLGVAFFSVLGPRPRIEPHGGGYSGRVRARLRLKVPQPVGAARIRAGDEMIRSENGKVAAFDDAYRRGVWNGSDERRVGRLTFFVRGSKCKQREWGAALTKSAAARS